MKVRYAAWAAIVMCSCSGCKPDHNAAKTNELLGKEVVRPELVQYVQGWVYSIDEAAEEPEYEIIAWINGDCVPCILELLQWQTFHNEFAYYNNVKLSFYVNSASFYNFESLTRYKIHFGLPVYYDYGNEFYLKNNLSLIEGRDALLIRNNRIIYAGNPIRDPRAKNEILNIIQNKK